MRILYFFLSLAFLMPEAKSCEIPEENIIYFTNENNLNTGLMSKKYISNQEIKNSQFKSIGFIDTEIGIKRNLSNFCLGAGVEKISTFTGSLNSLVIASKNNVNIDLLNDRQFVQGNLKNYQYKYIGISLKEPIIFGNLSIKVNPKLVHLDSIKNSMGSGILNAENGFGDLIGSISKQGMSSFGYTNDASSSDLGIGITTDLKFSYPFSSLAFISGELKNVFSLIKPNRYFTSDLNYSVHTKNNMIQFSDLPSISGYYTKSHEILRLPFLTSIQLKSSSDSTLAYGIRSVDGNFYPNLSNSSIIFNSKLITTFNFPNNIELTLIQKDFLAKNLYISWGLQTTLKTGFLFGIFTASYRF